MFRLGFHAPLTPFEASHPFRVDEVRPGARHGGGLLVTVKVNEHFALGRFAADFMIVVDQQLVTSLHEVDLNSFDAPFGKLFERRLKLIVERLPDHPKNDADVFLLGIGSQFFHVDFGNDLEHVSQLVPAFVEDDVRNTVFRGEINVVLVSLRVDAGFEIYAINVVGIPPVPGHLSRFDPGAVLDLRRLSGKPDKLIGQQVAVLFRHPNQPPRKRARSFRNSNILRAFYNFEIAVPFQFFFQGIGRKNRRQTISARAPQP